MTIELQTLNPTLYDRDFAAWIAETVDRLRAKDYSAVDWDNAIEELNAMGRREQKSLKINLVILLLHLVKWQYQPALRSGSWKGTRTTGPILNEQAKLVIVKPKIQQTQ